MHDYRPDTRVVGGVLRPQPGVFEQPRAEPFALPTCRDRQTREQHERNRMFRDAFTESLGRVVALDFGHTSVENPTTSSPMCATHGGCG